ncbi:MAG: cyclopropane-fatty-acyl-phospholipid synthase family protein [Steroidobacteraceae bacterium]
MTTDPFWDQRFAEDEYAYGAEPNDFLRSVAAQIPAGPVLCLAEGQGRNAVYLAQQGHEVLAVDQSATGLRRANELAQQRGVSLSTSVADLADFQIEAGHWSGIVSIFAHTPSPLRRRLHQSVSNGLRPGGLFVLEAYTPRQLAFGTGGPKELSLLVTLDALRAELSGLEFVVAQEIERDIHEGSYHNGRSAVVQLLARKPV